MILDTMENAGQYACLNENINRVLQAMQTYTPEHYPVGRVELDGSKLFMHICAYEPHSPAGALCEAHRKYIDVMYMVEGEETIYVKATSGLQNITAQYDGDKDCLLADTDCDATPVRLSAGSFVVLIPQDAHTPGCYADGPCNVKMFIGKVQIG